MSNIMDNGAVLPSGLMGHSLAEYEAGYNQTFKNFALRIGVVIAIYPIGDNRNKSSLNTEYDVQVMEQNADRGATTSVYRNCLCVDGFGSKADFFEKTLRIMEENSSGNDSINLNKQNGATVLLLCLDGLSDNGIIIGALTHPDRDSTLIDDQPRLEAEYNGVNIKVESDGSCKLTFKGATDNDGDPIDSSQGDTTVEIEKDGSVQVKHSETTFRLDKASGDVSIKTSGNVKVDCTDATVTATGTATVEGSEVKLGAGAMDAVIKGDTFAKIFNNHMHLGNLGANTSPPLTPMDPSLSSKVKVE